MEKTIKNARERGATDKQILDKIIKENPEKAKFISLVRQRGATDKQIVDKIIEVNKEIEKEREKEEREEMAEKKKTIEKKTEEKAEGKSAKKKETPEKKEKEKDEDKPTEKKKIEKGKKKEKKKKDKKSSESVLNPLNWKPIRRIISSGHMVGVDISDHSIEILLLNKKGVVLSHSRSVLDPGVISNGEIVNQKALSEKLKETMEGATPRPLEVPEHTRGKLSSAFSKTHRAIVSLPDSKTYVQVFEFDKPQGLYKKVEEKVKNTIPFDFDELYWDFVRLSSDKKTKVLCVAALRDVVDSYIYFFKSTNIEPLVFDIEGAAIGRALLMDEEDSKAGKMVLDIGARTSVLNIFDGDSLAVSVSLPYAGHYFTSKIADKLEISKEEAEELKREEGFKKDASTYSVLKKQGEKIITEIKNARNYYKSQFGKDIDQLIMAGGSSLLPGIVEFFTESLEGVRVETGAPLEKIKNEDLITTDKPLLFSNVIGLALRSLEKDPAKAGINLLPEEVKAQEKKRRKEKSKLATIFSFLFFILAIGALLFSVYYYVYLPTTDSVQIPGIRFGPLDDDMEIAIMREGTDIPVFETPSVDADILGEATPGRSYIMSQRRGDWVGVNFEGSLGWVQFENVVGIESVSRDDLSDREPERRVITFARVEEVGEDGLEVRRGPGERYEVSDRIEEGSVYRVLDKVGKWVMIEIGDSNGWIFEDNVVLMEERLRIDEEAEEAIHRLMN